MIPTIVSANGSFNFLSASEFYHTINAAAGSFHYILRKFDHFSACSFETVVEKADYVGSTTGIMDFAKKSPNKEFIIGTENSIVEHLQFECPDKNFYPLSVMLTCMNMKITT